MRAPLAPPLRRPARDRLLLGASGVVLLLAAAHPVRAQSIGALMAATHQTVVLTPTITPPATPQLSSSSAMAQAAARALRNQTQLNQAVSLATQAQAAAQAAAKALASTVPDGLGLGGLQPVAHPVPASADPTGLNTWQGANAPAADDANHNVTVVQTAPRAVLSWETFNVGKNTTLTFQQTQNGTAQPGWLVLNRVVGQIDPLTGMRDPSLAPAPSQILGSIKANGTVLVINQNGIIFGGASQVNAYSLIATSLEIGHALEIVNGALTPITIAQRNAEFLQYGLLGYADQAASGDQNLFTFSAQAIPNPTVHGAFANETQLEGDVQVEAGAQLTSADAGYLMLVAPRVVNAGALLSADGEVALQSGRDVTLQRSQGDANSLDPDVRGLVVSATHLYADDPADYVINAANALIQAPRGYLSMGATIAGAVIDSGVATSTTSVSRNGYVNLFGGDVELSPNAVVAVTPDDSPATIPQDPTSLQAFKPSRVRIGDAGARIDIGANALVYAPSANIAIGADPGPNGAVEGQSVPSRVFVDTGAVIDAAGLTDVVVPASRNAILIRPVKKNELRDAPDFRTGFLNGATVYVDPRLSGVRADGVAWVGSPLIEADSYALQVGVNASELMTTGGSVTLGTAAATAGLPSVATPDVIVKPGAVIDISGGWRTFEGGTVVTSRLVNAQGQVVDISNADPNDTYVAVYNGYTVDSRWQSRTYVDPVLSGARLAGTYTEGRDAGSLTLKSSAVALDGELYAGAFAGPQQIVDAQAGTAKGSVYGDMRRLQAAPSQLPAGGYLNVQAEGLDPTGQFFTGGGNVRLAGSGSLQPLPEDFAYGQAPVFAPDGSMTIPDRPAASVLPPERVTTLSLDAGALTRSGLAQLSIETTGAVDVAADAHLTLQAGGAFEVVAGRKVAVEGDVSVPGGSIDIATAPFPTGSIFETPSLLAPGDFDIEVAGILSTAGRWANDFNAESGALVGSAWIAGGEITLAGAPRVASSTTVVQPGDPNAPAMVTDVSGSLLVDPGALLDVSGGGYVRSNGTIVATAKGGALSLYDDTTYFQLASDPAANEGGISGFRVNGVNQLGTPFLAVNPLSITARVVIADGTIRAHGLGGGGAFVLTASDFAFGEPGSGPGADLPLDFFTRSGFASASITVAKTTLLPNAFVNTFGGYNAVLSTDVVTVGPGQTLDLTQSRFPPVLAPEQIGALQGLGTGGSLYDVLTPSVPVDTWDRRPVNLTLGGMTELHVAAGGQVLGEAGGVLKVGQLLDEGVIRIPGGQIVQSQVAPSYYAGTGAVGVHALSDVFATAPDGTIQEGAPNALGLTDNNHVVLTNAQVAATTPIYLLGDLDAGQGLVVRAGGVVDLAGEAIVNPRAAPKGGGPSETFVDGVVVPGGALASAGAFFNGGPLFHATYGQSVYRQEPVTGAGLAESLIAQQGATILLAGASASFDRPDPAPIGPGDPMVGYSRQLIWSDGGALSLGGGGSIAGAQITAGGGAPLARGGMLTFYRPVLVQSDASDAAVGEVAADAIVADGFTTFVAQGGLTSQGDVSLALGSAFFLSAAPAQGFSGLTPQQLADQASPVLGAGGRLEIDAPVIAIQGAYQAVSTPLVGAPGTGSVILHGGALNLTGAVVFDQSVAQATLMSDHDLSLIGVEPQPVQGVVAKPSLAGQLAANGDLTLIAAQIYPTTGSAFQITSAGADSLVQVESLGGAAPGAPYSAGGAMIIQAAHIGQAGVLRAPLGSITLGGNAPLLSVDGSASLAPASLTVDLAPASLTSVSAEGLVIPYGTTTDQKEWFFTPTASSKLTAPPAALLKLAGGSVVVEDGAQVNLKGGGDVYAYEFVSGTGGSRDVLDRFNADAFSSNGGYQYADHRQVYAVVPGLSDAPVASVDPVYSADYQALSGSSDVGKRVWLDASAALPAGWYTLLPAKYALLPGGVRVVEDTGAGIPPPVGGVTLPDGEVVTSGRYGGPGYQQADLRVFDLETQPVILKNSNIALTYGDAYFAASAAHDGRPVPQLPIDAGRLIFEPVTNLVLTGQFQTEPASGGRGSQVDISASGIDILPGSTEIPATPPVVILKDTELNALGAASLLIGGERTDNADGTTSLQVAANFVNIVGFGGGGFSGGGNAGDQLVLQAPELIFVTDGKLSHITVGGGVVLQATGTASEPAGAFVIDGMGVDSLGNPVRVQSGQGEFLRVANGPERLLVRRNVDPKAKVGDLAVGMATLAGTAVELNSYGGFALDPGATLQATDLALGAGQIVFGGAAPAGALLVTPVLQAQFAGAARLTLQSPNPIAFAAGDYRQAALTLDSPGIVVGGAVTLEGTTVTLMNDAAAPAACGSSSALACGGGAFALTAKEIDFGSGATRIYGADSVTLATTDGLVERGVGALDVIAADLSVSAPFLGDGAPAFATRTAPSLALTTSAGFTFTGAPAPADFARPAGTPGSGLSIAAASIGIDGGELRATAGHLLLAATGGVSIGGGAILATPGYSKGFGDAVDPTTTPAPAGRLELTAGGAIAIGDDSRLVLGGGSGAAATLALTAASLSANLGTIVDAQAPAGGASLELDTGGAFDLTAFVLGAGRAFTGEMRIRSGSGDLALESGATLTASAVRLTADGGAILDAGRIDTSGAEGGDVSLYGAGGVHLAAGAVIDAHAQGYGAMDTRQARAGNVTLGVTGDGAIAVDSGALIDVSATQSQNRLVPMNRTNGTYYTFVAADQPGTVTFRAPVVNLGGKDTVNVAVASGAVSDARSVVVEGLRAFDLSQWAAQPNYVGVTLANGVVTLDTSKAASGKINPLTDAGGPLVSFVQTFDVSADYDSLGGLASQANFHARPGVELDYAGSITLNSNWNLAAGSVDVAGAVAAGLMAPIPSLPGRFAVVPGAEGAIFARFTHLLYRVGGKVDGEPGVLDVRAGGSLDLKGSLTDGFFQFRDQTDPAYLAQALGGGNRLWDAYLSPYCTNDCSSIPNYQPGVFPSDWVSIDFPDRFSMTAGPFLAVAPYNPKGNSPSAPGSLENGTGDALGSAQIFPLLATASGTKPVDSWSFNLVAGARASADPLAVQEGAAATLTVEGLHAYTFQGVRGTWNWANSLDLQTDVTTVSADQWLAAFLAANPGVDAGAATVIDFSSAPHNAQVVLTQLMNTFFAHHPGDVFPGAVRTDIATASEFMVYVSQNFYKIAAYFRLPPQVGVLTRATSAVAPTLVRTGTGEISLVASDTIDLRNGDTPSQIKNEGKGIVAPLTRPGTQLGGVAVYTAGHLVDLRAPTTAVDEATGDLLTVNLAAHSDQPDVFASDSGFQYGALGSLMAGVYTGIAIANPVKAEGGGDVTLQAGADILGRRNTFQEARLNGDFISPLTRYAWIGTGDQPWRTGVIGTLVEASIDPQLFGEGVGTLAGGSLTVRAGRDVSDLTVESTQSLTTADVGGLTSSGGQPMAIASFGGGDLSLVAARDLLGGRVDAATGQLSIVTGGSIASAGAVVINPNARPVDNTLRLRVADAAASITASGSVLMQGVGALGVNESPDKVQANLDSQGFYGQAASISILADGTVTVTNSAADLLTASSAAADYTSVAVYPGTLEAVSMLSNIDLQTRDAGGGIFLYPEPRGTLTLLAAGRIAPVIIAQDDGDPTFLPGAFSRFVADQTGVKAGRTFLFPAVYPNSTNVAREALHDPSITHLGDPVPNRIAAGEDVDGLILSMAKQTRISAGRDIIDMVFFGQNVAASDITQIVAERDITASTALESALVGLPNARGPLLPAVQGNTFVLGGPGALFVEAGRDAGPFLNSAVTNGYATVGSGGRAATGVLTWGNGILTVGDEWNSFLPSGGADIYAEFGVAKGQNFAGLESAYLDPAKFPVQPGYLFLQTTDANGVSVPDRSKQIYALGLVDWMTEIAPDIVRRWAISAGYDVTSGLPKPPADAPALVQFAQSLIDGGKPTFDQALAFLPQVSDRRMPVTPWMQANEAAALQKAYGTLDVTYDQALASLEGLGDLTQREYLLKNLYFNELVQTSVPSSPSYLKYSRGYLAVNTLFPGSLGYTQNTLDGGPGGASQLVETGNLDLRLATIQTAEGGNIELLGPGGSILAGSTVRTSEQAARRVYAGGALYAGGATDAPLMAAITKIPVGYEGVITLRGGSIDGFTDQDLLLNQSRVFTESGGDIALWSSNADVNAGQGPKTSANFPPVVVRVDENGYSQPLIAGAVSGAGIAAFQPDPTAAAPDVFLMAPRGTVDAGDAGVRSSGSVFIAAYQVSNADAIQAQGTISGVQTTATVSIAAQSGADAAAAAAAQAAQVSTQNHPTERPLIFVDVLGFLADESEACSAEDRRLGNCN